MHLKGRVELWKGALETNGLRVNIEKTKLIIDGEHAWKVTGEGKFLCHVWRKDVVSNMSSDSFTGVGFIKDVVVLEVNWKRQAILNVRNMQTSKQI